jgi:hypothetical protein
MVVTEHYRPDSTEQRHFSILDGLTLKMCQISTKRGARNPYSPWIDWRLSCSTRLGYPSLTERATANDSGDYVYRDVAYINQLST